MVVGMELAVASGAASTRRSRLVAAAQPPSLTVTVTVTVPANPGGTLTWVSGPVSGLTVAGGVTDQAKPSGARPVEPEASSWNVVPAAASHFASASATRSGCGGGLTWSEVVAWAVQASPSVTITVTSAVPV